MYVKQSYQIDYLEPVSANDFECLIAEINNTNFRNPYTIIVAYKSPTCTFETFKSHILSMSRFRISDNLIIVGDFNYDVSSNTNDRFLNIMKSIFPKAQLLNTPQTTWENTQLDLCFTSCKPAHANIITCV